MKKIFFRANLLSFLLFLCTICTAVSAQECRLCGVWNGAYKGEFPSGDTYRVNVEIEIQSNKYFKFKREPVGFGFGSWVGSDEVFLVEEECNENQIKFYTKTEVDDWSHWARDKFKGKEIGSYIVHDYFTFLIPSGKENTLLFTGLGCECFYYDNYGNYLGKEWREDSDDFFICVLHQLEE